MKTTVKPTIAQTLTQLFRIALAGANKMTPDDYRVDDTAIRSLMGKQFRVHKVETGMVYIVSMDPQNTFCTCPFFQGNKPYYGAETTCKHLIHVARQAEEEAEIARRATDRNDYDPYGDHHQMAGLAE